MPVLDTPPLDASRAALPSAARDAMEALNAEAGGLHIWGGRAELRAAKVDGSILKFIGSLQRPGTAALSLDEIAETAAEALAQAGERGGSVAGSV
jgi:hypothetical protein